MPPVKLWGNSLEFPVHSETSPEHRLERFLSVAAVRDVVGGVSRVHLYRLMKRGEFPVAVKVGGHSLWIEREVIAWPHARVAERDAVSRRHEMARPGDESRAGQGLDTDKES